MESCKCKTLWQVRGKKPLEAGDWWLAVDGWRLSVGREGLELRDDPASPDCVWTCAEINFDSVQTPHYPNEVCQPRDWARSPTTQGCRDAARGAGMWKDGQTEGGTDGRTDGRTIQDNYYASADASGGLPDNSTRRTVFHYRSPKKKPREKKTTNVNIFLSLILMVLMM